MGLRLSFFMQPGKHGNNLRTGTGHEWLLPHLQQLPASREAAQRGGFLPVNSLSPGEMNMVEALFLKTQQEETTLSDTSFL